MLKVKEIEQNVYELTLQGVLEESDIQTMKRELTPVLKGDGPLGLIVRAEGWKDITAAAIAEDMKFEFGLMTQWSKLARMAIVTDMQAFAAVLKWVDPIMPMIEMKSFGSSEVAAAEAFVSDLPNKVGAPAGPGITLLADGSDGVIAYEIDGRITREDVQKVMAPLEPLLQGDKKINLFTKFKTYEGFDPTILADGSFIGTKFGAIKHLERYAVVGAPSWMMVMASGIAPLMPFEMRLFDSKDEAEACAWVGLS